LKNSSGHGQKWPDGLKTAKNLKNCHPERSEGSV
jgi:hypothetical protein